MAAALATHPTTAKAATHTLTVTFSVTFEADEHAQSPEAITAEARIWLAQLGADVQAIHVQRAA